MIKRERLLVLSGFFRGFGAAAILTGVVAGAYWQTNQSMPPSGYRAGFLLALGLLCIWMSEREIVA